MKRVRPGPSRVAPGRASSLEGPFFSRSVGDGAKRPKPVAPAAFADSSALVARARHLGHRVPSPTRPASAPKGRIQRKWEKVEGKGYDIWDQVLDDHRWYRKSTRMGFQYSRESASKSYPLKIFLRPGTIQVPEELVRSRERKGLVFGTQNRTRDEISEAIGLGYRIFDAAESYQNIGAVAAGIQDAGVPRAELNLVYKFDARQKEGDVTSHLGEVAQLFDGYLDMVLIHNIPDNRDQVEMNIKEMLALKGEGVVVKIGLSNLDRGSPGMDFITKIDVIENSLAQEELDLELREMCQKLGLEYLGFGIMKLAREDQVMRKIAARYEVSLEGLLLAWTKSQGISPILSSSDPDIRQANLAGYHEPVPRKAIRAVNEVLQSSFAKKKKVEQELPAVPQAAAGFAEELSQLQMLNNDEWNEVRGRYDPSQPKDRLKLFKRMNVCCENEVPKVKGVEPVYYGNKVSDLIFSLAKTNHCDLGKKVTAIIYGMRNTQK